MVIGGGQAGLAAGYYLRRTSRSWVILDEGDAPGGAWRHTWDSLHLFSPARWSTLPGFLFRADGRDEYPSRDEVVAYLTDYERRYALPVQRPVHVHAVERDGERLAVRTDHALWRARAVISAAGTWSDPLVPDLPGRGDFGGLQLHSADYRVPAPFVRRRVVVVGAGNSAAQIVAELSRTSRVTWATREPPRFLPDDVDGRTLFERATARYQAMREGRPAPPPAGGLGDIVMVPPVREACERGALEAVPMFARMTHDGVVWPDGREEHVDVIVWCTGFRPALAHLDPLGLRDASGRIAVVETRAVSEPRLWLVGYGEWTGFASATLIGVGRSARATVEEVDAAL
ncbi:MAG TPA: ArsO family NAD(P)H-dependent flavin-containing monooxygenase [Gemmatimonadaceae bacterium]|nr:ArsO family NAD(P)H-dependent flavin-containing monooxygenase [Gemmatimonadaceae bacterium]